MEKWEDITMRLKNATLFLELGQLVHDNNFGLYEAMSAIEIMEPKMDSGLIYTGNSRKINTFLSATEDMLLNFEEAFPMANLIFIIDHTYASLMRWLEGNCFVQTIMTNLYLHNPEKIRNRYLKVFTLSILKLSYFIKEIIKASGNYEEEDFQASTYGFDLASSYTYENLLDEWDELIETGVSEKSGPQFNLALLSRLKFTHSLLLIMGTYYKIVKNGGRPQEMLLHLTYYNDINNESNIEINKNHDHFKKIGHGDVHHHYLLNIISALETIKEVYYQGKLYCENEDYSHDSQTHLKQLLDNGFEPLANIKLLPPTFPRDVKILKPSTAYTYLYHRFFLYLKLALKLLVNDKSCNADYKFYPNILRFLKGFDEPLYGISQEKDEEYRINQDIPQSPCLLARSILLITYCQCLMKLPSCCSLLIPDAQPAVSNTDISNQEIITINNANSFSYFIAQMERSINLFNKNGEFISEKPDDKGQLLLLETAEPETAEISQFLLNASNVCLALVNVQSVDPIKRRDKLPLVLRDLSFILEEAERLDQYHALKGHAQMKQNGRHGSSVEFSPYFAWLLLTTMVSYMLYGFELQLYAHYELSYIYWYLGQLYGQLHMIMAMLTSSYHHSQTNGYHHDDSCDHTLPNPLNVTWPKHTLQGTALRFEALHNMCMAYHKCLLALSMDKQIRRPQFEFTTEMVRFEHRTSAFDSVTQLSPDWSYQTYLAQTRALCSNVHHSCHVVKCYTAAAIDFDLAGTGFGTTFSNFPQDFVVEPHHDRPGGDDVIRVCRTNAVACRVIASRAKRKDGDDGRASSSCATEKWVTLQFAPLQDGAQSRSGQSSIQKYFPLLKLIPQARS